MTSPTHLSVAGSFETQTSRLTLRRPQHSDDAFLLALHADALWSHERQMAEGLAFAAMLRTPDGALLGLAWWVRSPNPLMSQGLSAYRVMTEPTLRGRNLGRILMSGMHRLGRDDGAELVTLDYRSGTGVGAFYARCGYTEVGRVPGSIRVRPGDDRDSVPVARRLDGAPLRAHGRS